MILSLIITFSMFCFLVWKLWLEPIQFFALKPLKKNMHPPTRFTVLYKIWRLILVFLGVGSAITLAYYGFLIIKKLLETIFMFIIWP